MEPLSWTPMIYRVGARIHNLREAGWPIATLSKCPDHDGAHHAYYMLQTLGQIPMFQHGPDVEVDAQEVTR